MTGTELFRCERLAATLSRGACARRHERANGAGTRRVDDLPTELGVELGACHGCDVGAAHARGGSAAGLPVPLSVERHEASKRLAIIRTAAERARRRRTEEGDRDMPGKKYTHDGITDSLSGWAKRLELTENALRQRLRKGLSHDSVFQPRMIAKPGTKTLSDAKKKARAAKALNGAFAGSSGTARSPAPPAEARASNAAIDLLTAAGFRAYAIGRAPRGLLFVIEEAGDA